MSGLSRQELLKVAASAATQTLVGRAFKAFGGSRVRRAIQQSEAMRHTTLGENNLSLTGGLIADLTRDIVGAPQVIGGFKRLRRNINDLDVGTGALLLGNPQRGATKGLRKTLFLDKGNTASLGSLLGSNRVGRGLARGMNRVPGIRNVSGIEATYAIPSVSKPVKAVAGMGASILAYTKGMELYNQYKAKSLQRARIVEPPGITGTGQGEIR